eukprot:CAMPEP_0184743346 /NCGR_PEP_ID=MMETSP0315-20130426/6227_1 /TAXON_ID=101924 /ORGANISM="Rhodosorus marinus, Strain UTEX LB 2760" /LENGTH=370 /DNA_ID=CAMNT_0027214573 /DNA_START=20 /DNA_END=1132 /DNA_ORIENTATION=-
MTTAFVSAIAPCRRRSAGFLGSPWVCTVQADLFRVSSVGARSRLDFINIALAADSISDASEPVDATSGDESDVVEPAVDGSEVSASETSPADGRASRLSSSSRAQISNKLKGRKLSPETKEKIRLAALSTWEKRRAEGQNNQRRMREVSEETRERISESLRGRRLSPEVRAKISAALKGRKFSQEHRQALSESFTGSKNPMFGRKRSERTKKLISQKAKERASARNAGQTTEGPTKKRGKGGPRKARKAADDEGGGSSTGLEEEADSGVSVDGLYAEEEYDQMMAEVLKNVELPASVTKGIKQGKANLDNEKKEKDELEASRCPDCIGTGSVECSVCVGRHGVSSTSCPHCRGVGIMFCETCGGSGEKSS